MKKTNKFSDLVIKILLTIFKYFILFVIDGAVYVIMEILFRGHSHISMFVLGGIAGVIVGSLNNWFTWDMGLIQQMTIGAIIITCLEYITGVIVNIKLGLNVWDYSDLPFNVHGQVCLYFSLLWFLVSLIAILLDDWLRYKLFGEEIHKYKLV